MTLENATIGLLMVIIFFQLIGLANDKFKIGYYEQKLKNRGVDISEIEHMPWWKPFV